MIEITRSKSLYTYRVNPYNNREIDIRRNVANARWQRHSVYGSEEEARSALLQLERILPQEGCHQ